ncbi:MAG: ornithine carbamoyltransferase [Alphaproteobacteria bacterium]|nr:ornithine carbamoyltransferase [Alphaproteobacteria bacterium]
MSKDFIALSDLSPEQLRRTLALAAQIKLNPRAFADACKGQTLAMIFQKPSLRTRVSFQTGIYQLGGQGLYLGPKDIQLHRGESIADTARVLSRYVDGIMARVFGHQDILDLAAHASVPVINGLSDYNHPCQVVADLQTIQEKLGDLAGRKWTYVGDGNNMAHSILFGGALMGMTVAVAHPRGFAPDPEVVTRAREIAATTGGAVQITEDPAEGCTDADVVYTDVWASMGQEDEHAERLKRFAGFEVNAAMMAHARPRAIFMHCLPAHRGEECAAEVIDGPQSVVFDQAENRLHAQKAIMVERMGRR